MGLPMQLAEIENNFRVAATGRFGFHEFAPAKTHETIKPSHQVE